MKDKMYTQEIKVTKEFLRDVVIAKDEIEKGFIIKFFKNLPLDILKDIVNLQCVDFESKEAIIEAKKDPYLQRLLNELEYHRCVKYTMEIKYNPKQHNP